MNTENGKSSAPSASRCSTATELIVAERIRQVRVEDWDESHDDNHIFGELAKAASCYAFPPEIGTRTEHWPWDFGFWKPTPDDRIRELVKAGALIVAEIERLQRQQAKRHPSDAVIEPGTYARSSMRG